MEEAEDLLDYLNEHPTAAEILAAAHKIKVNYVSKRKTKKIRASLDAAGMAKELRDINLLAGLQTEVMPDDFHESIKYAQELMNQMKKKPVN